MTLRSFVRVAAVAQAILVAGVAIATGGSWWLGLVAVGTFWITCGAGTLIDQGVATLMLVLVCFGVISAMYEHPDSPAAWTLPAGVAAGLVAGWVISAILEWVFRIPIRRLGTGLLDR